MQKKNQTKVEKKTIFARKKQHCDSAQRLNVGSIHRFATVLIDLHPIKYVKDDLKNGIQLLN